MNMHQTTVLLVLAALVAGGEAAAWARKAEVHPGHEKQCYAPEIGGYVDSGTKRYVANCGVLECSGNGGDLFLSFESCGVVAHDASCTPIPGSRFGVYPECCTSYDCPEGASVSQVG